METVLTKFNSKSSHKPQATGLKQQAASWNLEFARPTERLSRSGGEFEIWNLQAIQPLCL
jgi:hypothetical protein